MCAGDDIPVCTAVTNIQHLLQLMGKSKY